MQRTRSSTAYDDDAIFHTNRQNRRDSGASYGRERLRLRKRRCITTLPTARRLTGIRQIARDVV